MMTKLSAQTLPLRLHRRARYWLLCAAGWFPSVVIAAANVTPVQFAVSEGGAATLSIPIQVPRGIGGMEPQLSLNYASGAGNGLLGLGWTLQGPSAITRCPQNLPTDGQRGAVKFNTEDRFCMDGQRLVLINGASPNSTTAPDPTGYGANGSEYRTERESFSRIKAVGAYALRVPNGFRVETKSGLILEFGNVLDGNLHPSQVLTNPSSLAAGAVLTINRWMLRRISDRNGSFVEFGYCKGEVLPNASAPVVSAATTCTGPGSGSSPIHFIRYTNRNGALDGSFGVVFRYETRPDAVQVFHEGSATRQTQRMSAVQTYINFAGPANPGQLVRSYDLYYEALEQGTSSLRATNASRLAQIQERGFEGSTVLSLPPVTFSLASDAVLGMNVRQRPSPSAAVTLPPARKCGGVVTAKQSLMCP